MVKKKSDKRVTISRDRLVKIHYRLVFYQDEMRKAMDDLSRVLKEKK